MKKLLLALLLCWSLIGHAQLRTYPLSSNGDISRFYELNPSYHWNGPMKQKWGVKDTLNLPFFDDFSQGGIYPDSSLWLNNHVYINRHFGKHPPTLGVATFDMLNAYGAPYDNTINRELYSMGDSLLSQAIDLKDSLGIPYSADDSIILSFYYQPNGYGYHLSSRDSLKLFFKNKFNNWVQVWAVGGVPQSEPFKLVKIAVADSGYFHKGFQFMFLNYSARIGNASQWNIDYVLMHSGRSMNEDHIYDYAIQSEPSPLLKNYYVMPYDQFVGFEASESADSLYVWASNMDKDALPIQMRHIESFNGNVIYSTTFEMNNANIDARGYALRRTDNYGFHTFINGPTPVVIERRFEIRNNGVINANTNNDAVTIKQRFDDYFAYDDGSAEQGFGFDHLTNPTNIPGEVAYRFRMNKPDTLFAIATFFNQAVFDVSREQFKLRVWQSIAVNGGTEDVLLYESESLNPEYMDKINQFSVHYLDSLIVLPAGEFYIGWYQSRMFNLNVGWDRNYGNRENADQVSANLYYKLFGVWSNADLPYGSLMMRPYVGSVREVELGIDEFEKEIPVHFYPNPSASHIYFTSERKTVMIFDLEGKLIIEAENTAEINVKELSEGMYIVRSCDFGNIWQYSKLVIFAP